MKDESKKGSEGDKSKSELSTFMLEVGNVPEDD